MRYNVGQRQPTSLSYWHPIVIIVISHNIATVNVSRTVEHMHNSVVLVRIFGISAVEYADRTLWGGVRSTESGFCGGLIPARSTPYD
jgi:hypothetical protein